MKAQLVIFLWFALATQAQDLRIIGTNLYDFSPIQAHPATRRRHSPYLIVGDLISIRGSSAVVRPIPMYHFVPVGDPRTMDRAEVRAYQRAQQAAMNGPLDFIDLGYLSDDAKLHFTEVQAHDLLIRHFIISGSTLGRTDIFYALPVAGSPYTYDCGTRIAPDLATNFVTVSLVSWDKVVEQAYRGPYQQATVDDLEALLVRSKSATNGSARAQCELGMHYLMGLGVETNVPLAFFWLRKAADQRFPEALEFLSTNSAPSRH
jgi:hypothetical protein